MKLAIFHTTSGILLGEVIERKMNQQMMGTFVRRPVVVIASTDTVTLLPMYTLTVEDTYFVPDHTLLYAVAHTPAENLVKIYEEKYLKPQEESATTFDLTVSPAK